MYSGDPAGSKYSMLDQINTSNVTDLEIAWTFETGDMRQSPPTTIQCNPIVIGNRMFLTTPALKLVSLKATTGEVNWKFDPYKGESAYGTNRGVMYWSSGFDQRVYYVAGSYLYALNAKNGIPIPTFGTAGRVDLYEGLGRDVFFLWVTAATPGIIYKDLLILGSTLGEGPGPAAPGHIRAYDIHTGDMRWIFHTIPWPEEYGYDTWPEDAWERTGGANAWGGFTLDVERGMVFCGTGSPTYDHWGGDRIGQNLFGNCILALDAATGERIWHYQVVHHDIWDYDIACPPNLVQVQKDGEIIDAIAQPTKMGHLFVLNRDTGVPIFPITEKAMLASDIPGEETWPTQPFPPKSLHYGRQTFLAEDITDVSDEARAFVERRLEGMILGDIYLPPSFEGSVTIPQFNGGTNWGGASYDPVERMLYVNCSNELEWISMIPAKPVESVSSFRLGQQLYGTICSACHGFGNPRNPGSPSLDKLKAIRNERTQEQIDSVLLYGKGQMPRLPALTLMERKALIDFIWDEGMEELIPRDSVKLSFSNRIPYVATGHRTLRDHEGFPANKRPWGTLNAIDLDKAEIVWQETLGTYPELEERGYPPTGTFNMGGPVSTAGGLVFIGATMDERFRAFDKNTGAVLWEFQLDAGAYATPSTFEVKGKQYVVIGAGGAGKPGTRPGDKYYCFTLP
jgi:quinoprotein glucose dehydrogenase